MRFLTLMILFAWGQVSAQGSAYLKVIKVKTTTDRVYYWLKDIKTKEMYLTICKCYHNKGEIVAVARKDLFIITDSVTKKDLN